MKKKKKKMVPWTNGALRGVELGTVMFIHSR